MVKRRGDQTPEPPGGRAAERLRMFEQARGLLPEEDTKNKQAATLDSKRQKRKLEGRNAKQNRRKT
jgi:hypothetical protein